MTPQIRIVVKNSGLLAKKRHAGVDKPVKPIKPVQHVQPVQPPRSKRGDLALLCQGFDIALEYFNSDSAVTSALTAKARKWADRYFKGYPYAAKRPTALLRTFPNLFNLEVEAHLRLVPTVMASPSSAEPEGASPRDLRRIERRARNSEPFPEFAEPTLASEAELDQVVDLTRQRAKPTMRVDPAMLRGSGLLSTLPEFLGQLARANLEMETKLANNPEAVRFELDEDQAAAQPHVEMNLFSGLIETQRRRHQRRIILPGGEPFKLPGDEEEDSSEHEASTIDRQRSSSNSSDADDSGDESDASTSTTASLRANLKKRKSAAIEDADSGEETERPSKIRLQYNYPPPELRHYDMKRRKLITRANPDAVQNDPFETAQSDSALAAANSPDSCSSEDPSSTTVDDKAKPTTNDSSSSSSSNNAGPIPITKIRLRSRSPNGSRSASPDRIIVLRHPVLPSSSSTSVRGASSSDESLGSQGSSSTSTRRPRIKVLQKGRKMQRDASPSRAAEKRLIEEAE
ncbi:uncharacterized protein B0T15DRAFT_509256 [Chaetomium strumarium]|uniref:Uncharacterized protein n=1 Tax=Chaetomium strumarium TaxID=1170767 RepID=A0AAJ0GZ80_9PEZI|nr:hypothetical protein B0T15DRAFT_509256 [Chaetomium strumarium]